MTRRTVAESTDSARDRLLAAAAEEFYANGVNGTGINTITTAAGVAKMSLYNNFASKDDLVLAYLEMRHQEWLDFYQERAAKARTPRHKIVAVFDAYIDHAEMAYVHGFRGCGILNAAAELPVGSPGREAVRKHKEQVEAIIAGHVAELGTLSKANVKALAEQLSFFLEGAMARAGLDGSSKRLVHARNMVLHMVDAFVSTT